MKHLQKSGEDGCFFFRRNGIFAKKLPAGVKAIRIYMPDGRVLENYRLGKIFYIDSEKTIIEVELIQKSLWGTDFRYFKYNKELGTFVEDLGSQ